MNYFKYQFNKVFVGHVNLVSILKDKNNVKYQAA